MIALSTTFAEERDGRNIDFNQVIDDFMEAIRDGLIERKRNVPHLKLFAAGEGAAVIENGFATLLDIVKALVSAIGTIVLLWGLFEWGTSLQSPNGAEQSSAFKRIGGGLVMILAPQLISLFIS